MAERRWLARAVRVWLLVSFLAALVAVSLSPAKVRAQVIPTGYLYCAANMGQWADTCYPNSPALPTQAELCAADLAYVRANFPQYAWDEEFIPGPTQSNGGPAPYGTCHRWSNSRSGFGFDNFMIARIGSPPVTIEVIGASRTKALVAGPVLPQTAKVRVDGVPTPNKALTIKVGDRGTLNGTTDANGEFKFFYVPPHRIALSEELVATCGDCTNTARKTMTVDSCDVCTPSVGNPIQPAAGEKEQVETDWADESPHPLTLTRTYRSLTNVDAGVGLRWRHNFAASAAKNDAEAIVVLGDGSKVHFKPENGGWVSSDRRDGLVQNAAGLLFTRQSDESRWQFDVNGVLQTITQRNGWQYVLGYSPEGRLVRVTNAFGRSLNFALDSSGRITAVTTPDGSQIRYTFDSSNRLSVATLADGRTRTYHYEDARFAWALTGLTAEDGQRLATFAYDASGMAVSTQHAGGTARFDVSYATPSTPALIPGTTLDPALYRTTAQVADSSGGHRSYTYQGGDGKVRLLGAGGAYDGSSLAQRDFGVLNLPQSETDFLGVTSTFTWDTARQLKTSATEAANKSEARTTLTTWHPNLRLPVLVTEPGRTSAYEYDSLGNKLVETVTDTATSETRTWRWTHGTNNLPSSMTDPKGGVWTFGYDNAGNRTTMRDPLGRVTTSTFDSAGRVLSTTSPSGLLTTFAYDARGRVLSVSRAGETSSFTYTPSGLLSTATQPDGYQVAYTYDAAQRLVAATDNRGATVSYTLDNAGNRVLEQVMDGAGNIALATARTVNTLNQVTAIQGAAGQTTRLDYDANGEQVAETDPLNQATRQTLDALRRTTATTFADNTSTTQAWSALDALTQVVDPKSVATSYTVNAFGEVTSETSPDVGTITFKRDASGEVVESTDAKGQLTRIQRDALGRITRIDYADGKFRSFSYDASGAIAGFQDRSGATSFERDALGRVALKTQDVADSVLNPSRYRVAYTYSGGALASITYPSGLKVFYRRTAGRIIGIDVQTPQPTSPKIIGFLTGLTHTALGQPKSWSWFNGDTAARSFDADGRMTANEFASYTWDAASRITGITQNLWAKKTNADGTVSNFTTPLTWTAGYDSRNRLTSFVRTGEQIRFSYDANGNRTSSTETRISDTDRDGAISTSDFTTTTYVTSNLEPTSNRLLGFTQTVTTTDKGATTASSTSSVTYKVDANGSLTSDGLREFVYGADGRLDKTRLQLNGEAASVRYLVNSLGQRVFKSEITVDQTLPGQTIPGIKFIQWLLNTFGWNYYADLYYSSIGTAYVYGDGEIPSWAMLGEYDNGSANASGRTEYIWLPTEDGSAIPVGMFRNGGFFPIHTDHLGTPRLMTNLNREAVWQWPYSAFGTTEPTGVLTVTTNPKAAITNVPMLLGVTAPGQEMSFRYSGWYSDEEKGAGISFSTLRDVVSGPGGRYWQADPAGRLGGTNPFLYVEGQPLTRIDPLGLWSTAVHNQIIRERFGPSLSAEAQALIMEGSAAVDAWTNQLPFFGNDYEHAMRAKGENIDDAKRRTCLFIQQHLDYYRKNVNGPNWRDAYRSLGKALHPIMDSTSPEHQGWQEWELLRDWRHHGSFSKSRENWISPEDLARTIGLINAALAGDDCACSR